MSDPDNPDKNKWLHDEVTPDLFQFHSIKRVLYSGRTEFQSVDIIDTGSFGICLVLDGKIQSSEKDEFIYHEALVHPVMLAHPNPETVFIAGGGEGATVREVLAHNTVKKAVMIDIDKQVIDICRQYLAPIHQDSFSDSRTELYFTDARKYLSDTKEKFDVIIIDLPEPLEEGPAAMLYTREFYQLIKERLNRDGIMSVQAGASGWTNLQNYTAIINTLRSVFNLVSPYQIYVPSFVDLWGFASASESLNPSALSPQEVNERISVRLSKTLKVYDDVSHVSLFALPKYLRHELDTEKRIITDKNPILM
jgi:spermidine synthase